MTKQSYQQVPGGTIPFANVEVTTEEQQQQPPSSLYHRLLASKPRLWIGVVVGCIVVAMVMVASHSSPSTYSAPAAPEANVLGTSHEGEVTPCTFDECAHEGCDHTLAPYTCLWHNGGPHGGCSAFPWTPESCTKQCDTSGCDDMDIPDSQEDCSGECSKAWCAIGRLCGSDASYQCTDGASAFGCSADAYQWTFKVSEAACSSCCDSNSCD
eukprot:CAMPEP_0194033486 /NCGR_PEP_ID=MMETSP0009_2-20130614/6164_1 /TAXON_ID=210454 /ORGANISM="Grammatophora oceanica, Strain CCMP 410" /LENGTH=211 /DNA_ID=CAMNT_0038674189 /DNA_START=171 /DNA_END=806 /DNA_ORIENTATION=+